MIENIKNLYLQVDDKSALIKELSKHVDTKPNTIRTHWLSDYGFWSIPEKHQEMTVKILQKWIKKQNT